jgi:hypothetical protein
MDSLSPVSLTPVINILREYLLEFSKTFETAPMEYLGARGTMIHEKNLKSKISCQTTFKLLKITVNVSFQKDPFETYGKVTDTCSCSQPQISFRSNFCILCRRRLGLNPALLLGNSDALLTRLYLITRLHLIHIFQKITSCAADFSLLNLPKGKSLGRSKPATNS